LLRIHLPKVLWIGSETVVSKLGCYFCIPYLLLWYLGCPVREEEEKEEEEEVQEKQEKQEEKKDQLLFQFKQQLKFQQFKFQQQE
jgi:hypothetical protein